MAPGGPAATGQSESVRSAARSHALDYYLTALLAPGNVRDDLIALAAFWGETGRIAVTAGEDLLGEIKLQWWRDALAPGGKVTGHPVADALRAAIDRRGLDVQLVEAGLTARSAELERLPFRDEGEFSTYLTQADGSFLRLSAQIRGVAAEDGGREFLDAAAQSLGGVRVARDLPRFAALGRMPLWLGALGEDAFVEQPAGDVTGARQAVLALAGGARRARQHAIRLAATCSRGLIDTALPLALVEPYLRALESSGHDPLRDLTDIAPLTRVVRLGWARVWGRF